MAAKLGVKAPAGALARKASRASSLDAKLATPADTAGYLTVILWIQVLTISFESPLRFLLTKISLTNVLYLRDVMIFTCIALLVVKTPRDKLQGHLRSTAILLVYILMVALFTVVLIDGGLFSALFSIKLFNTFLFGLTCTLVAVKSPRSLKYLTIFVFLVTCTGVVLNKVLGVFPWEGAAYETAFGTVETSRVWWIAGGERRLAGFCRASYTAAAIIAVTGTVLQLVVRNFFVKLVITGLALASIYLTTSKGVVLALLGTSVIAFTPHGSGLRRFTQSAGALFFATLGLVVPFISWYVALPTRTVKRVPGLLSSFADRATNTWPDALNEYVHWYNWLIGKGLGGVGQASAFSGSVRRLNPIDSMHLFLYGNLGIIGTALFVTLALVTIRTAAQRGLGYKKTIACSVIVLLLGYGNVTNILDDAFSPIALGIAWGLIACDGDKKKTLVSAA